MKETEPNVDIKKPFIIVNILPEQHVKAFRKVAPEFGVKIRIIARPGQRYTDKRLDEEGNVYTYNKIVPEGFLRVRIASPATNINLNRFYEKAGEVLVLESHAKAKLTSKKRLDTT